MLGIWTNHAFAYMPSIPRGHSPAGVIESCSPWQIEPVARRFATRRSSGLESVTDRSTPTAICRDSQGPATRATGGEPYAVAYSSSVTWRPQSVVAPLSSASWIARWSMG